MSHRICTGISRLKLGKLIEEVAHCGWRSRSRGGRGVARPGFAPRESGPNRELPFADRVMGR